MRRSGIMVTSRELRYHDVEVPQPDGSTKIESVARARGIDVRLSLDVVRLTRQKQYEVGVIFSQDQDLDPWKTLSAHFAASLFLRKRPKTNLSRGRRLLSAAIASI
jgi:hypothetical protein